MDDNSTINQLFAALKERGSQMLSMADNEQPGRRIIVIDNPDLSDFVHRLILSLEQRRDVPERE